jgi:hypothetical protein
VREKDGAVIGMTPFRETWPSGDGVKQLRLELDGFDPSRWWSRWTAVSTSRSRCARFAQPEPHKHKHTRRRRPGQGPAAPAPKLPSKTEPVPL